MIKKLIFIVTACLFAAGTIINMHLAQNDHNMDFSLADISVMAQADPESGGGLVCDCVDCPQEEFGCWSYDYSYSSYIPGNEGYEGSWQCEGAGRIEKNVTNRNGPC